MTDSLAKAFEALYGGVVYDAMTFDLEVDYPFVLSRSIGPIWRRPECTPLFGPAFTCRGSRVGSKAEIDDLVRIEMFRHFHVGCVQVIDTGGDTEVAHFGDISGKLARKFGAVGAVIDGYTRDVGILEDDSFPVYCRGAQPIDAFGRWQIVEYEAPVALAGALGDVRIEPGDFLFADADGVMVIRRDDVWEVARSAQLRSTREQTVRRRLLQTENIEALYHEIGRW